MMPNTVSLKAWPARPLPAPSSSSPHSRSTFVSSSRIMTWLLGTSAGSDDALARQPVGPVPRHEGITHHHQLDHRTHAGDQDHDRQGVSDRIGVVLRFFAEHVGGASQATVQPGSEHNAVPTITEIPLTDD